MEPRLNQSIPHIVISPPHGSASSGPENRPDPTMQLRGKPSDVRNSRNVELDASARSVQSSVNPGNKTGFWGADGFSFSDLIDFVNPLQHIPIVSTIYRAITGDEIGVGPRLFGGAMLGGIVGVGSALVNAAVENETGRDVGGNLLAAVGIDGKTEQVASLPEEAKLAAADPEMQALPEIVTAMAGEEKPEELPLGYSTVAAIARGKRTFHQGYRQAQYLDMLEKSTVRMNA